MFVTFEGSEGSGKSTQLRLLVEYLQAQGREIVVTREPGGTQIGEQIRDILHDVANTAMTSEAEILLYSAARAQLVREVIRPALAAGKLVLSDRYYDSTYAYQGYGRGLDLTMLRHVTQLATGGLKPDLTIFFDLSVERGLARRVAGGDEMNRMDQQQMAFYERVYAGYQELVTAEPERWHVVNGDRPVGAIQAEVRELLAMG
ncbi:MAG: dTMP kinase [Ardenticatenales bacterium]|nr:dTMP kinase [Ardenticatenales bacterium]